MKESRKCWWALVLFAISSQFAVTEAVAQSKSAASKRSFATLLARKAEVAESRAQTARVAFASTTAPTRVTNDVARSAVRPLIARAAYGVSASTAVVPPSGYGSGRDAYVEALYPQILGRTATQSDVDYWARVLASGVHADTVARQIWNSQEHKSLERSGQAPDVSLKTAYDRAYAVGLANCKERLAAESRHRDND
jgi:hypothetical protein